jgi:hypothetical protein
MESTLALRTARWPRRIPHVDGLAVSTWLVAGGLTLYLGVDGGGYDLVVRSQAGIVIWWAVLVGAACGLVPRAGPSRAGWAALALLGGFLAWSALASTWSLSSERSLQEASRLACYFGSFVLALLIHSDRERAVRHTTHAVAAAIVAITGLALVSRLFPAAFPAAHTTASYLTSTTARVSWPLNYWNAVGALAAFGVPLLLAIATGARRLGSQAAAAAAIPLLVLCGYLTFSRAAAVAAAVAVVAFIALAPERIPKLGTLLVAAAGSAVLIAGAVHRRALDHGLGGHQATVQGEQLLVAIALVCAGVGLAQAGVGLAARHGTLPRRLRISPGQARVALGLVLAGALVVAIATGLPGHLEHAWHQFKSAKPAGGSGALGSRFTSLSGEGRYDLWKAAVHSSGAHLLTGSGPGTFQFIWDRNAPYYSAVINAHSLYVETLAEVGLVGLVLLTGFFVVALGAAVRLAVRSQYEAATLAAGTVAALLAFAVSASVDWVWQIPALPIAFLLLAAAVLAPTWRPRGARNSLLPLRVGFGIAAVACLVAIGFPLATMTSVRASQAAVTAGDTSLGLADARAATRLEPGSASAQVQAALVWELRRHLAPALAAARRATRDEPDNWTGWLVLSRIQAESGQVRASIASYRRARSDDPRSPLFRS